MAGPALQWLDPQGEWVLCGTRGHKWQRPVLGTCEESAQRAVPGGCTGISAHGQCSLAKSACPLGPGDQGAPEATCGLLEVMSACWQQEKFRVKLGLGGDRGWQVSGKAST